jgi:hypothetical protein
MPLRTSAPDPPIVIPELEQLVVEASRIAGVSRLDLPFQRWIAGTASSGVTTLAQPVALGRPWLAWLAVRIVRWRGHDPPACIPRAREATATRFAARFA